VFDVGFFELLLVGLVALLVFGPERLPSLARTAGLWLGRARRFLSTVKADIEQELKAEELKRIIREQQLNNPLRDLVEDTEKSLREAREQAEAALRPVTQPPPAALSEPPKPAEAATPSPPSPMAPPAPAGADRAGADVPVKPGQ
jgi:sec-independent protein translocase protein TatB